MEAKASGREQIVITEVPYQVNRDALTNRIGELVNEKVIEGIAHVNNESNNKEGTRVVIDLKRDAVANVIINQLYKHTESANLLWYQQCGDRKRKAADAEPERHDQRVRGVPA